MYTAAVFEHLMQSAWKACWLAEAVVSKWPALVFGQLPQHGAKGATTGGERRKPLEKRGKMGVRERASKLLDPLSPGCLSLEAHQVFQHSE